MNAHELKIQGTFERDGISAKATTGSGATSDDGDLKVTTNRSRYIVECKERTKNQNVTVPYKFIEKVKKQSLARGVDWIIVYTNSNGEDFVLMDLNQFIYETRRSDEQDS